MAEMYEEPQLTSFVERPDYGEIGRSIQVRTNFFRILDLPEANFTHYDVTITPDVPPPINRKVVGTFEAQHRNDVLGGMRLIFDGRKNIFTSRPMLLTEEDDGIVNPRRIPRKFTIKIRKVGMIDYRDLMRHAEGKRAFINNVLKALMAIDILIRQEPSMNYVTVRRSFYTTNDTGHLFGGLEARRGYYQSAKCGQKQLYINIDITATAFYESCSLIMSIAKILGRRGPEDLRGGMTDYDHQRLERAIKGLKIRVVHRGETQKKRKYRIRGITPTPADRTYFQSEGQQERSVAEYFATTYHRRLNFPFLPCVVVNSNNTFLPMEVCEIVEDQRYTRKLNDKQTADMIKFTCVQPHARANKILEGFNILNYRDNQYLRQFGLRVPARVLPTPTIQYHPSSREAKFRPINGVWNLRDKKVATGTTLGSWSVVVFSSERDYPLPSVKHFIRELVTTFPNVNPPVIHANPLGDNEGTLKQAWLLAGNHAKAQPQLILCILPNTGVDLYAQIKRVSDTVIGVVTQCVQGRNIMSAKKQYCANVCLKINVKLGGMNSFLLPEEIPFITDVPTILMGADVTHPGPGSTNKPSIAALCASMDAKASRYAASIRIQSGRTDIIADLSNMVKELLKTFYQTCGRKPDRILFYRDGISYEQFKKVLDEEINSVRALQADYAPKITFIVVQKRHHARFFSMDRRDADNTGNCLPGTVIERGITHPIEFDFYLQSQAGLQGTSRPTHYHVLYNENNLRADQARFHSREHWSDTESSESAGSASTFSVVKPELQKVEM
ncbi:740_t:CDS:10 [Entrophospora sp. SA101]|nr:740_t:CDS:10 [Entrophospora sp. SA101]